MNKQARLTTFLVYGLIVTWMSLQPGDSVRIGSYDKLAHFLTYAVFVMLAYRLGLARLAFYSCAFAIVIYSGLLELGQSFVPGRFMSGLDLVANTVGVLLGVLLCSGFSRVSGNPAAHASDGESDD